MTFTWREIGRFVAESPAGEVLEIIAYGDVVDAGSARDPGKKVFGLRRRYETADGRMVRGFSLNRFQLTDSGEVWTRRPDL